MEPVKLRQALELLGQLLEERGEPAHVLAVGGAAMILHAFSVRPTADLDVLARKKGNRWGQSAPLPPNLRSAISDVGLALGLPGSEDGTESFLQGRDVLGSLRDLGHDVSAWEVMADV